MPMLIARIINAARKRWVLIAAKDWVNVSLMNMVSWFCVTTQQMLILYNGTRIELINTDFSFK